MSATGAPAADAELAEIRSLARPLRTPADLDPLVERIGDARCVLLGEASHGTAEYYGWRAALTRRLVAEHGFAFVAVEGDWPDCRHVDRWVKGTDDTPSAEAVLARYDRWPTWMWANTEVADFARWLRRHNAGTGASVGFYGLDVYSLWDSLRAVLRYLEVRRPDAVEAAHEALACFEPYGEDPQAYARATVGLVPADCEGEVIDLLVELSGSGRRRLVAGAAPDGDEDLDARQNAEVAAGAERYYRAMVRGDHESWNVRDCHMADTLDRLLAHHGDGARCVVWEHNTHIGDARATDMAGAGMVNVGQLVRERHEADGVVLVGFAGGAGQVMAADFWGAPGRVMPVPPPAPGTHEELLQAAAGGPSLLVFPEERGSPWLMSRRGHRAIGVVYRPRNDPFGNWVPTVMGGRYDALVWLEGTTALRPLHGEPPVAGAELETFPWSS